MLLWKYITMKVQEIQESWNFVCPNILIRCAWRPNFSYFGWEMTKISTVPVQDRCTTFSIGYSTRGWLQFARKDRNLQLKVELIWKVRIIIQTTQHTSHCQSFVSPELGGVKHSHDGFVVKSGASQASTGTLAVTCLLELDEGVPVVGLNLRHSAVLGCLLPNLSQHIWGEKILNLKLTEKEHTNEFLWALQH